MNEKEEMPFYAGDNSTIRFPIELLDHDICVACPEMKIKNVQQVIYDHPNNEVRYVNHLRCIHYERCRYLAEAVNAHEKHAL